MRSEHLFIAPCLFLAACGQDLRTVLQDTDDLSVLDNLLSSSPELLDELNTAEDITILAPSDEAWGAVLSEDSGPSLLNQKNHLNALLHYHVLDGRYTAQNITEVRSPFIPTLLTDRAYVNITGGQVVHATRNASSDSFTIYSGYNQPSTITRSDIPFSSGFIHILSSPLNIPANITTTALSLNLTSLVGATQFAAFPWDAWSNSTFFAPTDLAFSHVGSALTALSQDELHTIMMYHVINDTTPVYTSHIDHAEWISTTGTNVTFTYPIEQGETVFVNEAAIIVPNVLVANGVMHIVDNVLNPNGSATATPTASTGLPAWPSAIAVSTALFTDAVGSMPASDVVISGSVTPGSTLTASASAATGTDSGAGAEDGASLPDISSLSFAIMGLLGVGTAMMVL